MAASKGERTKQRIVAAALELFREHGYEATTMRMVAEAAEVSLGNAHYYFKSKNLLLQAFYREVHDAHTAKAHPLLKSERTLLQRLRAVMPSKLEVIEPYHRFSTLMFRSAAAPNSPLNPFHPAGEDIRIEGEALFAKVLTGSSTKIPAALQKELPNLLWTYSMGIVLYWIHDSSKDRQKTRRLIERTVDLCATAIKMSSNALLRPFQRKVLQLLKDLQFGSDPTAAEELT